MPSLRMLQDDSFTDPLLAFQPHQFVRKNYAVSAETRLSGSDFFHHMHFIKGGSAIGKMRYTPEFANSEIQLRKVLAVAAWQHCHGGRKPFPPGLENDLPKLRDLLAKQTDVWQLRQENFHGSEQQQVLLTRHALVMQRCGGWLEQHATIAYMAWKLYLPATDIARTTFYDAVERADYLVQVEQRGSANWVTLRSSGTTV